MHCHWLTSLPCWLRCEQSHWFKSGSGAEKRSNAQEESHDAEAVVEQVFARDSKSFTAPCKQKKMQKKQLQEAQHHMSKKPQSANDHASAMQGMNDIDFAFASSDLLSCLRNRSFSRATLRSNRKKEKREVNNALAQTDIDAAARKCGLLTSSAMMLMMGCGLSQESSKQDRMQEAVKQSTPLQPPLREKNRRCARLVHIHDKLSWKIQWKSSVRQEACTVSLQGEDVTASSQAHECACTVEAIETNCCLQAGRVLQCVDLLGQAGGCRLQGLRQG